MKAQGLSISLSELEKEDLQIHGSVPSSALELMIGDDLIHAKKDLHYDIHATLSEDAVLAQGSIELELECECVRCLEPFPYKIRLESWAAHYELQGEDKVEIVGDLIDLTPNIREDVLLAFPQHPLCSPDCTVKNQTGTALGSNNETEEVEDPPSPWSALDNLKL